MRALLIVGLLACLAHAEQVLVRVVHGEEPVEDVAIVVLAGSGEVTFDEKTLQPQARTDETGTAIVEGRPGQRILSYRAGYAVHIATVHANVFDVALDWEVPFSGFVMDSKDEPVAGAEVVVETRVNRSASFLVKTDAKGRFFLRGLLFDTYDVRASKEGYFVANKHKLRTADAGLKLRLTRKCAVLGTVKNANGKSIAGAVVSLDRSPRTADENGAFEFECRPGTWMVRVDPRFGGVERRVTVAEGARVELELRGVLPAQLVVRVVNEDKEPIAGALVLGGSEGAVTDAEGRAVKSVAARWKGVFMIHAFGYDRVRWDVRAPEPGATQEPEPIVLRRSRLHTVQVKYANGDKAAGHLRQTNTNVQFKLDDGAAEVWIGHWEFISEGHPPFPIRVRGPRVVELPKSTNLRGRLVDRDGKPVTHFISPITDENGRFDQGPVWGDKHDIDLEGPGYKQAWSVRATNEIVSIRVPWRRTRLIGGVVTWRSKPVRHFSLDDQSFADEQGRFEFEWHGGPFTVRLQVVGGPTLNVSVPRGDGPWRIRVPDSEVTVVCTPTQRRSLIELRGGGGRERWKRMSAAGTTMFHALPPGEYQILATGYETQSVVLGEGAKTVIMQPRTAGTGWSLKPDSWLVQRKVVAADYTEYAVESRSVKMRLRVLEPDRRRTIDLDPAGGGWLVLVRSSTTSVPVTATGTGYRVTYRTYATPKGKRVPLPPGRYRLPGGRDVTIVQGEETRVEIEDEPHRKVRIRAVYEDGSPAVAATAQFGPRWADADAQGYIRFELRPGSHEIHVESLSDAYVHRTIVIGATDLDIAEPFVLRELRERIRILAPMGGPLASAVVWWSDGASRTNNAGWVDIPKGVGALRVEHDWIATRFLPSASDGEVVRTRAGGHLAIRTNASAERVELLVGERRWPLHATYDGLLHYRSLPSGPVTIRIAPDRAAPDDESEPEPEADVHEVEIVARRLTTVDLDQD